MSDWAVQFAKLMKSRMVSSVEAVVIGEVKQASPLRVMIFDGQASLTSADLIYTTVAKTRLLVAGDRLILLPLKDMSKFILLDKEG